LDIVKKKSKCKRTKGTSHEESPRITQGKIYERKVCIGDRASNSGKKGAGIKSGKIKAAKEGGDRDLRFREEIEEYPEGGNSGKGYIRKQRTFELQEK